jgi:anti-sigma factor RsiW
MDDNHVTNLLSLYIDGQSSPSESEAVAAHLKTCPACAAQHEELRRQREWMKSETVLTPPESFYRGVLERIEAPASHSWGFSMTAVASACIVVLVVAVTYRVRKPSESTEKRALQLEERRDAKPAAPSAVPYKNANGLDAFEMNAPAATDAAKKAEDNEMGYGGRKEGLAAGGLNAGLRGTLKTMSAPAAAPPPAQWKGNSSGVVQSENVLVRTPEEWKALWTEHTQNKTLPPLAPEVDFSKYSVVGVFVGNKPTSGWRVDITHLQFGRDAVHIQYRIIPPPVGARRMLEPTQPFEFRIIPKTDLPVIFTEETK